MRNANTAGLRSLITVFLLGAAAGLNGCLSSSGDPVAQGGAQDFPNTVALGMAASTHLGDRSDWDQFSVIPSSLPTFKSADSLAVDPEALYPAAAKTAAPGLPPGLAKSGSSTRAAAALSDTVYWDSSDIATRQVVRRIHLQETALKSIADTIVIRFDEQAGDSLKGNELILESKGAQLWKASERRQAYRYLNTDSAGGFDRAVFAERLPAFLPAGFKIRVLVMMPGPDGDFGTVGNAAAKADNRPVHYAYDRTRANADGTSDTTESFDISDADGDGTLWGAGDSGVVDFRQLTPAPALRPAVASITQKMRAVLFKDEQKTYPISFRETRVEKSGRKVAFSVRGFRDGADSAFAAGDTAVVNVSVTYPDDARLLEKHSRYRIVLSGTPKRYAENKLIKYTLDATWRKDSLSTTRFSFTPDAPVPSQELSISGKLELDADLANGHGATALGRYENKIFDVILTDKPRNGNPRRFHVKWDSTGGVLVQESAD